MFFSRSRASIALGLARLGTTLAGLFSLLALVEISGLLSGTFYSEISWTQMWVLLVLSSALMWWGWRQRLSRGGDSVVVGVYTLGLSLILLPLSRLVFGVEVSGVVVPTRLVRYLGPMSVGWEIEPWYVHVVSGFVGALFGFLSVLVRRIPETIRLPLFGICAGIVSWVFPDVTQVLDLLSIGSISSSGQWTWTSLWIPGSGSVLGLLLNILVFVLVIPAVYRSVV